MFISIAVCLIICGILLFVMAKKVQKTKSIIIGIAAVAFIILGVLLIYCLLSGKIVLPLN